MAFKTPSKTTENISVIVRQDNAIPDTITDEDYSKYQETLDESLLNLSCEPTRFIMRLTLPYDAQVKIQNAQLSFADGKPELKIGYILEDIRCSLVDIKNPPNTEDGLVFSRDDDGYASRKLISELSTYGIINQLFVARNAATARIFQPSKK